MSAAKAAMKKLGVRRWAGPLPPDAEDGFSSQEDLEEILDRFEETGIIQVQFGEYGVYTITSRAFATQVVGDYYTARIFAPVLVWWKGETSEDNRSVIINNSRMSYHLPYNRNWGQLLQINLTANFFDRYGVESELRQAAAGFLNMILAGVPIHRTRCGVTSSNMAYDLNILGEGSQNHEIRVLPRPEA